MARTRSPNPWSDFFDVQEKPISPVERDLLGFIYGSPTAPLTSVTLAPEEIRAALRLARRGMLVVTFDLTDAGREAIKSDPRDPRDARMNADLNFVIHNGQRWIRHDDARAWQVVRYSKKRREVLLAFGSETMTLSELEFRRAFRPLRGIAPLRKVIGHERNEAGGVMEVLECGHRQYPKGDIAGETNATLRRCNSCFTTVRTFDFEFTPGWKLVESKLRDDSRIALLTVVGTEGRPESLRFDLDKAAFIDVVPFTTVDREVGLNLVQLVKGKA